MADSSPITWTLDLLDWTNWVERATETNLPAEKTAQVAEYVAGAKNSAYIDVLSNDLAAVKARAKVHHHVYTSTDPDPTAWRELGATTTSRINGCVFCASVHARMYAAATKNREVIQRFLDEGIETELPETERAVVDLATKVTLNPEGLNAADLEPLRALGFDDAGILDVINYAAFFGNANRLMLTLGEPVRTR